MSTWTAARPPTATSTPLVEIVVTEALVAPAAARLHALISDALGLRPDQLVIDLADCPFADAFGLDILLRAHRRAWQLGSRLTLRNPSPRLERIFGLAHVDHVFEIVTGPAHTPPSRRRDLPNNPTPRSRP